MGHRKALINCGVVLVWWLSGVAVMGQVDGLDFLTSSYIIVQILTTIGYGDIYPSPSLYGFVAIYVLLGICIIANIVNDAATALMEDGMSELTSVVNKMEHAAKHPGTFGKPDGKKAQSRKHVDDLLKALGGLVFFVALGTAFYSWEEACTCSYGASAVAGCNETSYEVCEDTGGKVKSVMEAAYMAVITLTTVGFGDFTPATRLGRAVGIFWMLFSVLSLGNFVQALGTFMHKAFKQESHRDRSQQAFQALDVSGSGQLDRHQFLAWMLVKESHPIKPDHVPHFYKLFDAIDDGKIGFVSYATICKHFHGNGDDGDDAPPPESPAAVVVRDVSPGPAEDAALLQDVSPLTSPR